MAKQTPAMARASNVFPVPGGPWSKKPRGGGSPMDLNTSGFFECSNNSQSSLRTLLIPPMLSNVYSDVFAKYSRLNFFDACRFTVYRGAFRSVSPSNGIASSLRFFVIVTGDDVTDGTVPTRAFFDFIVSSRIPANVSAAAVAFAIEPSTISFGTFEKSSAAALP